MEYYRYFTHFREEEHPQALGTGFFFLRSFPPDQTVLPGVHV